MNQSTQSSVVQEVISQLIASLPPELEGTPVSAESLLREDLGLDSLRTVDLVIELEDKYSIVLETEELGPIRTVGDLIALIDAKRAALA